MKWKWSIVLIAVLLGVAFIPLSINGCGPDNTVSRGGVNQEMNTDRDIKTEVATFALG